MDRSEALADSRSAMKHGGSEKRVRRSAPEGQRLAAQWQASGMTAAEFSRQNHVPMHVLRYWRGRSTHDAGKTGDFFVMTANGHDGAPEPKDPLASASAGLHAVVIVVPLRPDGRSLTEALRAVFGEVRS